MRQANRIASAAYLALDAALDLVRWPRGAHVLVACMPKSASTSLTNAIGAYPGFRKIALAAAYGIAVTLDMTITTIMTFYVIRHGWKYPLPLCLAATGFFFVIDVSFFASNMLLRTNSYTSPCNVLPPDRVITLTCAPAVRPKRPTNPMLLSGWVMSVTA